MDIAVIELESKIRKIVAEDNGRVAIFDYQEQRKKVLHTASEDLTMAARTILVVSTFNEATKEVHVMYTTKPELEKATCLQEVLTYLEIIKPTLSPYSLRWKKKGEPGESTVSHFYCNDALEVLEKFFANKKREEYVIFSLEMKGYA